MAERLTEYDSHGDLYVKNHDYISASYKLAHYEDLAEQGRLIELPCAVGDTVYCLAQYVVKGELTNNFFVNEIQISSFEFDGQLYVYDFDGIDYSLDDIFLTKEEAEAKLKELRGEQND
mgnify:CR=1 FL=1